MNKITPYRIILIIIISSLLLTRCEKDSGLPVDGDGNEYDTVVIGTQTWLAENLKTTKYNNGVSIPLVTDNNQWISTTTAAFCWYGNNSTNKEDYGALYNWWAVKVSFLCPVGYHVPTKEEWSTLIDYLGGEEIAGGKLKATGIQYWSPPNYQATNESGFTAMPGGMRKPDDGTYYRIRSRGHWWSSSPWAYEDYGYRLEIDYSVSDAILTVWFRKSGFSVRCLKD
jgi:uncharacterized protein (TIGR02145 family)